MSTHNVETFDSTLQKTHIWINDVMGELDWKDEQHRAYLGLRTVLQALRDRLTIEESAQLAAQLPMLIRGFYYEGWNPTGKPVKERHKEEFLAHVADAFRRDEIGKVDPESMTRAVFRVIAKHVTPGEIEDVKLSLPAELRELW